MEFLEVLEVKDFNRKQGILPETQNATQKIVELRRKRDSLKIQLKSVEKMIIENKVTSEENNKEVESKELMEAKDHHEEMRTLLDCYRLTGFSVFSVEDSKIVFSYDTSYLGNSGETFYLEMENLQNEQFVVRRHTFPPFIPVIDLEKSLLKDQPRHFLMKLSDFLYAYISRREETKIALNKFKDILSVNSSEPYDFMEVKIGLPVDTLQLEFHITYTDLLDTRPSRFHITTVADDESVKPTQKLITQWQTVLTTEPFSDAVGIIVEAYKKLNSNDFDE